MKMVPTLINGKWELLLPDYRAARPEWPAWEYERLARMHERIKPGMTVLDIGTEEGDLSALIAQWLGDDGTIVLFEPNDFAWPNIKAIWEANKITTQTIKFPGFASPENKSRYITDSTSQCLEWPKQSDNPPIGNHGFRTLNEHGELLPQIRIDDFCSLFGLRPDVITVDVEGSELEVLKGAYGVLKEHVPDVFVSVHPEFMWQQYGQYEQDLHGFMLDLKLYDRPEHLAFDHEHHYLFKAKDRP